MYFKQLATAATGERREVCHETDERASGCCPDLVALFHHDGQRAGRRRRKAGTRHVPSRVHSSRESTIRAGRRAAALVLVRRGCQSLHRSHRYRSVMRDGLLGVAMSMYYPLWYPPSEATLK